MPNHVRNVIEFSGDHDRIEELLEFVSSVGDESLEEIDQQEFDFNEIVPQHENVWKGSYYVGDQEREIREAGMITWYEFNVNNWGTKWNCYEISVDGHRVEFDTAWSMPEPIYLALSEKFPDVDIMVSYADEDIGSNCGRILYKNGQAIPDVAFDRYSDESCDFATRLRYGQSYEEYRAEWEEEYEDED